ncbi:MAG: methylmalonyl-CoA mutase [Sphaerobacteraceae bacterium]|nr:MAG: methylmalonyl-CoA mutase [Sphaerobacteraceae bacterium]
MAGDDTKPVYSDSGIEIHPVYRDTGRDPEPDPGVFPYTRGIYPTMYRSRPWTMRQYAGFSSAEATNQRFKLLLDRGQTGLSVAFDLPTQLGMDSDDPQAQAEVGRVGVAISTLDDMRRLLDGIDLSKVSTSMTINAPASLLMLMYQIVAEEQGVDSNRLGGTVQNDILKEYAARGTFIFPPRPSMRLITDTFAYCQDHLPQWNTISISGYHIREAGSTASQEIGFTLSNGIAYVRAAMEAGLDVDQFAPRLSFFFNAHSNFFEEIAKYRAARRMWATLMREWFGASGAKSMMMRFHTQTAGSSLTAQQPLNNVVRVAYQAMAAVLGGTQSLHTNGYDEALALPTEESATLALRTQQILSAETGVAEVADPLAGSYFIEELTDQLEAAAWTIINEVEEYGGAVVATERGFIQDAIADSAYIWEQKLNAGEQVVIGVNKYQTDDEGQIQLHHIDDEIVRHQIERVKEYRAQRDNDAVERMLDRIEKAASGDQNLLPVMKEALQAGATVGDICGRLRKLWGRYRPAV